MAAEKSRNEADDFTTDEDSDDGKFDWDPGAKARAAQEDPGGSGKAGGAKGMMYSVMYVGGLRASLLCPRLPLPSALALPRSPMAC